MCVILQTTTEHKMAGICSIIIIVLIGISASIEGKYLNDEPTTTANEFLIRKWKIRFNILDVNHDGKISKEDIEEIGNTFSDLEHLNTKQREFVTEEFNKYWEECIFAEGREEIFENDFVGSNEIDFNANTKEFVKERRRCFKMVFSAIDVNEDKSISKEELQIIMGAGGHSNVAKDNDSFYAYGPKNGLIPLCDVVDYWVEFATSKNESKGNIVKSGFDVNGFY